MPNARHTRPTRARPAAITACRAEGSRRDAERGRDIRGGWRFTFAYDERKVMELKLGVPPEDREYDPETREWWVAAHQAPKLRKLFPDIAAFLDQPRLL